MQLLELLNEVLLETGRQEVTATAIDNDQMTRDQRMVLNKLNNEIKEMYEEWEWDNLKNIAEQEIIAGEETVELTGKANHPPNPFSIKWVRHKQTSRWDSLELLGDEEFEARADEIPRFESNPDFYRIADINDTGNALVELYPTPGSNSEIRYRYFDRFEPRDNSADLIILPDRVIMWGTVASVLRYDGEDAEFALQKRAENLQRAKRQMQPKSDIVVGGNIGRNRQRRQNFNFSRPLGE